MTSFLGHSFSRRQFVGSVTVGLAASVAPIGSVRAQSAARYTRYNVSCEKGQEMLKSYGIAVKNLMALKPDDPRNWFRNAFIHTLDCPHGNWWFFVWHRGYLGWFEQTLRDASGNPDFAIPYWDWTETPRIPDGMFDDALNPSNPPYDPYIKDFKTFYNYLNPALTEYWKGLSASQLQQLETRMIPTLNSLWTQVKGDEQNGAMFATTRYARFLTADSPEMDASTQKAVEPFMVRSGLKPVEFAKFNSVQTPSHNSAPGSGPGTFGILEGNPHNKVHNNVGGVGHIMDPLNFGYMADNLSPVDPLFFLHHSNMDRLWDVWTRKQQKLGLPTLPVGDDLKKFEDEKFEFYVNRQGKPVDQNRAGDYVNIGGFDYGYQRGFGEDIIGQPNVAIAAALSGRFSGETAAGVGAVNVPLALLQQHAAGTLGQPLVVQVTVPRPTSGAAPREFDVLINAPPGTTAVTPDSPYYVGTISFFGFMRNMTGDATFTVPLPQNVQARNGELHVQVVPHSPALAASVSEAVRPETASVLKAVAVSTW